MGSKEGKSMKDAFARQLHELSSLWQEPNENERVYFLGEVKGRSLAVYYCYVADIEPLTNDWVLLETPKGDHALPRLRRGKLQPR